MTNEKWSKLFGFLVITFSFLIPLFVIVTTYISLDTTTSYITIKIIGILLLLGVFFGIVKFIKKRIAVRKEMGLKVSAYTIMFSHYFMGLVGIILFTAFIYVTKAEIQTLWVVMFITSICQIISFILKIIQTHFDIKVIAEQNT